MADSNVTNLFDLSYDQINAIKKKDLVNHIKILKGKVTVDATIKNYAMKYHSYQPQSTTLWQKMGKLVVNQSRYFMKVTCLFIKICPWQYMKIKCTVAY